MVTTDKYAVLYGGYSSERVISLQSGKAIFKSLLKLGFNVSLIDIKEISYKKLRKFRFKKIFIALHGKGGEDGFIQKILESFSFSYTGSNSFASFLSMDKIRCKKIWKKNKLPIISPFLIFNRSNLYSLLNNKDIFLKVLKKLELPFIIKPNNQGSSIGINIVFNYNQFIRAIEIAFKYNYEIIIEKWIDGFEYSVSILNNHILPSVLIEKKGKFYDFRSKYYFSDVKYQCPSGLSKYDEKLLYNIAFSAYKSLGCHGWGRIDFIRDKINDKFYLLEINTVPGMTKNSLFPVSAEQVGIDFPELVRKILSS